MDRNRQLFVGGDITPEAYESEQQRLSAVRDELLVATTPQSTIRVEEVLVGWRLGTPDERRQLLGVSFDALHVKDGQVAAQTPREDRVSEVVELIGAAMGDRERVAAAGGSRPFAAPEREGFEHAVVITRFG